MREGKGNGDDDAIAHLGPGKPADAVECAVCDDVEHFVWESIFP